MLYMLKVLKFHKNQKKGDSKISQLTQNLSKQLKIQILTLQSFKTLKSVKKEEIKVEKVPVLSNLDSLQIDKKFKPLLILFPPDFEAIETRPMFLDIAGHSINYPDLEEKKKWFGVF